MSHSCSESLCVSPHYANDDHAEECLCEMCHPEHDWQAWTVWPECEGCIVQMYEWISENIGHPFCECGSFHIFIRVFGMATCLKCYALDLDEEHTLKEGAR